MAELIACVKDPGQPIGKRMRAAYYLRSSFSVNMKNGDRKESQEEIIEALSIGLRDERQGSLMRHEFAYILGQLRDDRSCPALEEALLRDDDCVMVRHEAAEALGAIGAKRSYAVLNAILSNEESVPVEIAETVQISLDVMKWRDRGEEASEMPAACACMLNPYSSVDPAPPHPSHANKETTELGNILADASLPLFERYRAMFSLRNIGGKEAVLELCRVLVEDESSALLRHEVAYVLGQMQCPTSIKALEQSLRRASEHKMVRHESAEALGAIDGRWDAIEPVLKEFAQDNDDVVRESCLVALDTADYWQHNKSVENIDDENKSAQSQLGEHSSARQKADHSVLQNHFNVAC